MHRPPRSVLKIDGLCVRRGNTSILDQVTWEIQPGEHWVILGANGSGKTSLLSSLTGYLMPTAGAIDVLGCRYGRADWRGLRQRVGLVSSSIRQMMAGPEPALASVVSGRYAMIDFWGKMTLADRRHGLRILRLIECAHLADRPWQVLSQGERQRILIGRALMARPALLILDEPCAGLDPAAREHFLQFLERLGRERGAPTLVLVTHHVEEIMPVFTHVLVLREGQVLAAGVKSRMLTTQVLREAFASKLRLQRVRGRYQLAVAPRPSAVI